MMEQRKNKQKIGLLNTTGNGRMNGQNGSGGGGLVYSSSRDSINL